MNYKRYYYRLKDQVFEFSLNTPYVINLKIIVLLALLFFIVMAHIGLRNSHPSNTAISNSATTNKQLPSSSYWLQPAYLNDLYPQLIGSNDWQLDFMIIEEKISNLKLNNDKNLLINADMVDILQIINLELPKNISHKEWQRIQFLLVKGIGNNIGESFYKLINAYYLYDQEKKLQTVKIKNIELNEKIDFIKSQNVNNRKTQAHYFGSETAVKLFSKKNQITEYLNSRRIINMNKSLSKNQKKEQLSILAENYKMSFKDQ
jgi:hypothetical protein